MARRIKICSMSKLNLLKYAKQAGRRCYPKATGRMVDKKIPSDATPRQRAFARVGLTNEVVFCCGKRPGRHRARGRHRRRTWTPERAYRAHVSYRRRRRRR